jgi:hypothetical protein
VEWVGTVHGGDVRTSIVFKEWAPDQPDMGADALIRAHNVIPSASGYKPFRPLDTSLGTIGGIALASYVSAGYTKFDSNVYAWDGTNFYVGGGGAGSFTARGTSTLGSGVDGGAFAQYEDLILFTAGNIPKKHTAGSSSNFSTLAAAGTAPPGSCIGVVGQFVLIGDITDAVTANRTPSGIQWCAIDDPTNWPTPNSATAIAAQAGFQELQMRYGRINGIHGGDQHGVVLQDTAITRVTYVGPPVVFQFDTISNNVGSIYKNGSVRSGEWIYFTSRFGPCRTNGVVVERIGAGKVDDYLTANVTSGSSVGVKVGYDYLNRNVLYGYTNTAATAGATANSLLIFNEDTGNWSSADTSLVNFVTPGGGADDAVVTRTMMAFSSSTSGSSILGYFQATAGSAVFETSDSEVNPGGRAYVDGVKLNVESSGTAPAMTARIGYRDDLSSTPTYTSATSANSATGFANFRVDAKYHRAEFTITGNFQKVTGAVVSGRPSGLR